MSNLFWSAFFGTFLGFFSVNTIQVVIDEYRAKQRRKNMQLLLEQYEDLEADDEDD